ncbi:hypothetical protein BD410DRAFT_806104 [Rickenella mellea]|uniref:Uncharacterized protein n=1 Tax=Rickenella mellea TaxID=50990 RepID=A0A4Y7PVC9_9AGAM|nr:hypothetical protein BD410DRAFT_806104 [Rickenella mellea]
MHWENLQEKYFSFARLVLLIRFNTHTNAKGGSVRSDTSNFYGKDPVRNDAQLELNTIPYERGVRRKEKRLRLRTLLQLNDIVLAHKTLLIPTRYLLSELFGEGLIQYLLVATSKICQLGSGNGLRELVLAASFSIQIHLADADASQKKEAVFGCEHKSDLLESYEASDFGPKLLDYALTSDKLLCHEFSSSESALYQKPDATITASSRKFIHTEITTQNDRYHGPYTSVIIML